MIRWGIMPVIFSIGNIEISSYQVFMGLAFLTGFSLYIHDMRKNNTGNMNASFNGLFLVAFAVLGGLIGSKLPLLFMYWDKIIVDPRKYNLLNSGRTIIGGLLGGAIGAFMARRIFNIKERLGNQIAIPICIGMAIGRIGCFFTGCCYGIATKSFFGVDFGDHILRHPTQLYEIVFDLVLAGYLYWRKKGKIEPGQLFKIFINSYLSFRFFLEFIRVELKSPIGLTDFQIICIISLIYINRKKIMGMFKKRNFKIEGVA